MIKTEAAIALVKEAMVKELASELKLMRVSSPLVVLDGTGINDDLNGIERAVAFPIKAMAEKKAVVVHSLAKWKRLRLTELGIALDNGIIADMRALRPDEDYTPLHSIYVDQWDWEKHIDSSQRTLPFLKATVSKIYSALRKVELLVQEQFPEIPAVLPEKITFIHAEELLLQYPLLNSKERENAIAEKFGAVFIMGIGGKLSDGDAHDGRAPDYDDWSSKNEDGFFGLNGDIIVWHPILKCAFELSSMGIRVNKEAMLHQLKERNCLERTDLYFHNLIVNDKLTQSIGGGIGQSRVCMFMLKKTHIGEVQVSIWPDDIRVSLAEKGVTLL